jgi:hypothetical protein
MKNYQYWLLVVGLAVYVGAVGVLTADSVFHLGLFRPKLDRMLATDIVNLGSGDAEKRRLAQDEIVSYHEFAVPPLLRALERGDARQKERCAECLRQIAAKYFLSDAGYGTDAAAWRQWWEIIQAVDGLRDERPSAREKAQDRIVSFGRAAVPVLMDTLRDPNRTVRILASDTLVRVAAATGRPAPDLGPDREKWMAWWKDQEGKK